MIQTTIRNLLDKTVDTTGYRLYLVKDDSSNVLYVGQSTNFAQRLRGHIASRVHSWGSLLGAVIYKNKPYSDGWQVDLYTVDECSELIKKWFPRFFIAPKEMVRYAEDALTHEFNPLYNKIPNTGHCIDIESPFLERKKREKEEKYTKWQAQLAQKREHLVNSVCDVCGEHDTWVNVDDTSPCGVLENHHGFNLLCHSCDHVINLMNELKEKSDRVHKVEKALASVQSRAEHAG